MKPTRALRSLLLSSGFLAAVTTTHAQSTWTGGGADALWTTAGNWNPSANPASGASITFNGSSALQLSNSLGGTRTVGSLTFTSAQTTAVTINTVVGTPLTFNPGNVLSVAAGNHKLIGTGDSSSGTSRDLIFTGSSSTNTYTLDIASGASFETQGRIGATGTNSQLRSYFKTGVGTLIFSGNSGGVSAWQHGGLQIQQGALRFANSNAGGSSGNNYVVSSGAALEIQGGFGQGLGTGTHTLNGTGINSTGALRSISGNNSISGTSTGGVSLATNSSIGVDADTLTISDDVKGTGALTKVGSGTLVLGNVSNSYAGATTVTGGTLAINGALTTTTGVTVETGAKLQGSGTINSSVTIQSNGSLAPGNSIESLGVGALGFLAGSTYAYEIQTNLYAGTPNDAADLTDSTGTLDIAAGTFLTLTDLATSTTLANGSKLTLISYFGGWTSAELFTYNGNTLADDSTFTLGANQWLFNYNDTNAVLGSNFSADQTGATSFVTMTVVPEPAAALLGSIGFFALLCRRRR